MRAFRQLVSGALVPLLGVQQAAFYNYTDANRPTAGNEGTLIYNTTEGRYQYDNGTDWVNIITGADLDDHRLRGWMGL